MDVTKHLDRWERRLMLATDVFAARGASVDDVFRAGPPAPHVLHDAAHDVGRPIPDVLTELGSACAALRGCWRLPDDAETSLPSQTREVLWGGLDLSVKEVVAAETSRRSWVTECFPNRNDPYDVVWHDKFAFHTVANGDCLAIADDRDNPAVYYLSHDGGEGHGAVLAPSLLEFLDRWSLVAFAGPEDWLLLPFITSAAAGIDPAGSTATEWRAALGLTELSGA